MDILAVLRSFAPRVGAVASVTVYPSDYGLSRMAEEAVKGPQVWHAARLSNVQQLEVWRYGFPAKIEHLLNTAEMISISSQSL